MTKPMAPDAPSVRPETRVCWCDRLKAEGGTGKCAPCLASERAELIAALKAMVASYDGLRDALTCPTVLAKLAAADAALAKAEGLARITGASS